LSWLAGEAISSPLHKVDKEMLDRVMALGASLVSVWLAHTLPLEVPRTHRRGRSWYQYAELTEAPVRSLFGVLRHLRPTYRLTHGKGAPLISPYDRQLGLAAGRMSLAVHLRAAFLCARMSFDETVAVMRHFGGYTPSKRAVLGITDELGPQASAFMDDLPAPEDDGEILVIQVDRKGAPMMSPEEHEKRCKPHKKRVRGRSRREARRILRRRTTKKRKKKGDKSKNARMASVGVVYTLHRLPDGTLEGPIHKRVFGSFRSGRHLFERLLAEAKKRGYGEKKTYFLADGELSLWTMQKEHFPLAIPCLDWYHLCEYLWDAGTAMHKAGSKALEMWVREQKDLLRAGDEEAVLQAIEALHAQVPKTGPGTKGRREKAAKAIRYITNHREQIRYAELLADDVEIATGAIEGAVKHVMGSRLDGSGMRWCRQRAEAILALRCVLVSGEWSAFEKAAMSCLEARTSWEIPSVTPQKRMEPYKAKKKAA